MAINQLARALSITWTAVSGQTPTPPTGPIANIQSFATPEIDELAPFLIGTSRVDSHYAGKKGAAITIETADLGKASLFKVGQKFTGVALDIEAAKDSAGTEVGETVRVTLSHAVVSEVGEIGRDNADSAPLTRSVTFTLSKFPTETDDPTYTIAEVS